MMIKNLEERTPDEIVEIYDMIRDEVNNMLHIIGEKTGYYATGRFNLFAEEPKKCMDIDMKIALLEAPHEPFIDKLEYYIKQNPNNCLNKSVIAHRHNSWYMIYNGVHRTASKKLMGFDTVKTDVIIPNPKNL